MEKRCDDIKYQSLEFSWHTRGSVSYTDVLNMSDSERKLINRMIDAHLEATKSSKLPYF